MKDLYVKYDIKLFNTMPFIYHVSTYQNNVLISSETGHVICSPWDQIKKPKFIMEASLVKVVQTKVFSKIGQQ